MLEPGETPVQKRTGQEGQGVQRYSVGSPCVSLGEESNRASVKAEKIDLEEPLASTLIAPPRCGVGCDLYF